MRIGIDARLLGLEHAGLGRYIKKLVDEVLKQDKKNTYVLFLNKRHLFEYQDLPRVETVEVNIPIYSFAEQIILPIVFARGKLDLLHVPHFNAPIFYQGKLLLTIHDLIKHHSVGPDTTTRHPLLYHLKRLGYLFLTQVIVWKSNHILVPSKWVMEDLVSKFKINPSKITVTYEAVDNHLQKVEVSPQEKKRLLYEYRLSQPFIVYTGSVYPHKNVSYLVDALKKHNETRETTLNLAIICSRGIFYDRLEKEIIEKGLGNEVKLLGFLPDDEVSKIYSLALALVHPSRMEGFGLTGLEAMKLGLPVLSSNASCLPEIYGDAALYFSPEKVDDLVAKLKEIIHDQDLRKDLSIRGVLRSKRYSWYKMAKETRDVYRQLLGK